MMQIARCKYRCTCIYELPLPIVFVFKMNLNTFVLELKPKSAPKPAGGNVDPTDSTSQSKKNVAEKEASTRNRY